MKRLKQLIVSMFTMTLLATAATAQTNRTTVSEKTNSELTDSLRAELALVTNAEDSLRILYDILDLAAYADRGAAAEQLYNAAVRANDVKVQTKMLCYMASIAMSLYEPDIVKMILERAEALPPSEEKNAAICLIKSDLAGSMKFENEKDLSDEIQRLLNELKESKEKGMDRYDRIAKMFTLTEYLQGFTQGTYLTEFLDRLDAEIAQLPINKATDLRSKFYASAAMLYLRNEQFERAANADRKLLSIIDRIQEQSKDIGRKYREPIINRYISYRRLLKCYSALSEAEVQSIYDTVMEMAARNEDIANDMSVNPLPQMALHMKREEYAEALPLLKTLAANATSLYDKKYYLRRLKTAAEAAGNHAELARAAIDYCNILEEYTDLKTAERMRELQVNYNYESLRENDAEKLRNRERWVTTLAIISTVLLFIVIIVFIIMATRLSSGKKKLAKVNEQLRTEGEELRQTTESLTIARDRARKADTEKTQLVNYVTNELLNPINSIVEYSQMIIDNAEGENKKYLERFKSIVDMNIRLLLGLVGDVQELAVVEGNKLPVNFAPVDLNAIASTAVYSIRPKVNKDVKLTYHPINGGEKTLFTTDSRRVEIVLLNLLTNAAKFTQSGSIDLKLEISPETGDAIFSVTDTGIGVPADKAETIFERFEKLNPDIEGSGLGLAVCRLVCYTLDASVHLDTTYPGPGARFIFTIHPHA